MFKPAQATGIQANILSFLVNFLVFFIKNTKIPFFGEMKTLFKQDCLSVVYRPNFAVSNPQKPFSNLFIKT